MHSSTILLSQSLCFERFTFNREVVEKIAVARPGVLDLMDAAIAHKLRQQQEQQQQQRSGNLDI